MLLKLPTEFDASTLDDFCDDMNLPRPIVRGDTVEISDTCAVLPLAMFFAEAGYMFMATRLSTLNVVRTSDRSRQQYTPPTRRQLRLLKAKESPIEMHRRFKQAERELHQGPELSQDEINCLLRD